MYRWFQITSDHFGIKQNFLGMYHIRFGRSQINLRFFQQGGQLLKISWEICNYLQADISGYVQMYPDMYRFLQTSPEISRAVFHWE